MTCTNLKRSVVCGRFDSQHLIPEMGLHLKNCKTFGLVSSNRIELNDDVLNVFVPTRMLSVQSLLLLFYPCLRGFPPVLLPSKHVH